MIGRAGASGLLRALRTLAPAADIRIMHQRPWHSITFSGAQICLSLQVAHPTTQDFVSKLSAILSEHEFHVPGHIVADIAVTHAVVADGAHCLIIDALLLDE
ncbi:MAG: hypothetical protein B7Y00_05525 [Sphingomonadales bacterium 17-56-6]|nr:MAG: hypothetical protein B7Y44_04155 [Sphingomonadales bacterium 28-55-16]OYZ87284.1 MAG: hypothetical protein B7Y00_05525 [Sphingomonadales bacterium 17-56-6]